VGRRPHPERGDGVQWNARRPRGDGEFEVRRNLTDTAGADTIAGRATNQRTGVVCGGQATV